MADVVIAPQKGKQEELFSLFGTVDFLVTGGSRFGGKSTCVSMMSLLYKDDPKYNGIVFRREFDQLMGAGGLWEMATQFYPLFGATAVKTPTPTYTFPSGAKVRFKHMYNEDDAEKHRGLQYSTVVFEEITQFSKKQVQFLLTCLRSEANMNSFCVGTCNPDPSSWLLELLDWYIDPNTGLPLKERQGKIRYFIVLDGDFVCGDSEEYFKDQYPDSVFIDVPQEDGTYEKVYVPPKTFSFVQLTIFDNPSGMRKNPRYLSELQNLPDHEREAQLWGNWHATPKGSAYWQREWVRGQSGERVLGKLPEGVARCWRGYDKAGTARSDTNKNPDFTAASPKIYKCKNGYYYLTGDYHHDFHDNEERFAKQLGRFRKVAGERDHLIVSQALLDGDRCTSVLAQDSGSAGITEFENAAKMFITEGLSVIKDLMPNNKNKLTKFTPFASACQLGLVFIVESTFPKETLEAVYRELEKFDGERSTGTKKDDWVDSIASAFNAANKAKVYKVPVLPNNIPRSEISEREKPDDWVNTPDR